jgi:transposase
MSEVPCFIGIDVATAQLDMAVRPSGERWAVPNDASGITTLVDQLQARHPTLMVLEATGGLERAVTSAWATGQLATTDAVDARALAHVADVIRPTLRPLPEAPTQELRALLGRRQPLEARESF